MNAQHLFAIVLYEHDKLFTRLTARLGWLVLALLALLGPFVVAFVGAAEVNFMGNMVSAGDSAPHCQEIALWIRNHSHVVHVFVVLLASLSVASEYQTGTMREILLRPVPRMAVPLAKWAALLSWIAVSLALSWLTSTVAGLVVFGFGGPWVESLVGHAATFACDAGFAAMAMFIAIATRSVAGSIGVAVLFALGDTLLGWALKAAALVGGMLLDPHVERWIKAAIPWLPSSAFAAWTGYPDAWVWQSAASLGILLVACGAGTLAVQRYVDVP